MRIRRKRLSRRDPRHPGRLRALAATHAAAHAEGALLGHAFDHAEAVQALGLEAVAGRQQLRVALQQQAARIWARHSFPAPAQATLPSPPPGERLRLAYLSRDFRSHPVAYLMAEVIELHDRARFEVIALSYGPAPGDPMQQRLRQADPGFWAQDGQRLARPLVAQRPK